MILLKNLPLFFFSCCLISCQWLGRQVEKGLDTTSDAVEQFVAAVNEDIEEIEQVFEPAEDSPGDDSFEEYENITAIMARYPELEGYTPYVPEYGDGVFHISGNFFGDRDDDLALLVIHEDDAVPKRYEDIVALCVINKGEYGLVFVSFDESNPGGDNYYWVGEFMTIPVGEPLWSNYEDDFRGLADVPWDEVVRLPYDAIYVHVAEACGGGFIFWKNGKWNWLQQE